MQDPNNFISFLQFFCALFTILSCAVWCPFTMLFILVLTLYWKIFSLVELSCLFELYAGTSRSIIPIYYCYYFCKPYFVWNVVHLSIWFLLILEVNVMCKICPFIFLCCCLLILCLCWVYYLIRILQMLNWRQLILSG